MRISTLSLAAAVYVGAVAFTSTKSLVVTSPAFENNAPIPVKYTCKGAEFSPPLNIANIPANAKSLAIIVDDPDAERKVIEPKVCVRKKKTKGGIQKDPPKHVVIVKEPFVHWLIWNIAVDGGKIPENFKNDNEGRNSSNETGYKGMCPPSGTHHYHFKVYALDTKLNIPGNTDKVGLEKVMQGHILAWGEVVGLYNKDYK